MGYIEICYTKRLGFLVETLLFISQLVTSIYTALSFLNCKVIIHLNMLEERNSWNILVKLFLKWAFTFGQKRFKNVHFIYTFI